MLLSRHGLILTLSRLVQELISNRIHLNRILGLSNLYYIDPEDREICSELQEVRSKLAELISHSPEASLEQIWAGDFGDRYWAMVRSAFRTSPWHPSADEHREALVSEAQSQAWGVVLTSQEQSTPFWWRCCFISPVNAGEQCRGSTSQVGCIRITSRFLLMH